MSGHILNIGHVLHTTTLGLLQMEYRYVGYILDGSEKLFAQAKLDKVLDFPITCTIKEVRGFIGLANYFSEHVKDLTLLLRPIRGVLNRYEKEGSLIWEDEQTEAFENVKRIINDNQKLHFYDREHGECEVYTDASDYGLGDIFVSE
jgi:hypothetical protein